MKIFKIVVPFLILGVVLANAMLSQTDYANIVIEPDDNSYILLNNTHKYCYMPYYGYDHTADLRIREGKNFLLSLLKPGFKAFSKDPERNFLFCEQSGFGVQLYGLYIKLDSMDNLLNPTPEKIYRIVVLDSDGNEALTFKSKDTELFSWFIENYARELNDYFFPINVKDENVYNEEYEIHVEYQNGELSRFLRCIDEDSFKVIENKKTHNT